MLARWYWVLAFLCLACAVAIAWTTAQKSQERLVEQSRKDGIAAVFDENWTVAERNLKIVVKDKHATGRDWFMYGLSIHYQHQYQKSIEIFRRAEKLGYFPALSEYNIACGESRLGNSDAAIDSLGKAVDLGFNSYDWMKKDPDLDPVRDDPRFEPILTRVKNQPQSTPKEKLWTPKSQ